MSTQTLAQQEGVSPKKWFESSNFWTALVLAVGGFFVDFPEEQGHNAVMAIFALLASVKAIREYFTELKPKSDVEEAVNKSNWWNYIATIAVSIVPSLPVEAIDQLQNVATNAVGGNWQGALIGLISLGTILYNVFWRNKAKITTT